MAHSVMLDGSGLSTSPHSERIAMDASLQRTRSPARYFGLVFVLSLPLWLIGKRPLPLPVNLPVSALAAFVPALAAGILTYQQAGRRGVQALFKRTFDYKRIDRKRWYLPALLLAPLTYLLSYVVMRLTGSPLPSQLDIPVHRLPAYAAMYFVAGTGEELGWTGYALEPMQARRGAFQAGWLEGIGWAVWHSISFFQTGNPANWVLWQCLRTVALRLLIVWIYNSSGKSVFASSLIHAADNVSWSLFPNSGSHYSPLVTGSLNWLTVGVILATGGTKAFAGRKSPRNQTAGRQ